MSRLKLAELRTLFDWIISEAGERWGEGVPLDQDFYRMPDFGSIFREEEQSHPLGYGSLVDEADLLKKSVLAGETDSLDVVAERLGYVLLAIADVAEREQR